MRVESFGILKDTWKLKCMVIQSSIIPLNKNLFDLFNVDPEFIFCEELLNNGHTVVTKNKILTLLPTTMFALSSYSISSLPWYLKEHIHPFNNSQIQDTNQYRFWIQPDVFQLRVVVIEAKSLPLLKTHVITYLKAWVF